MIWPFGRKKRLSREAERGAAEYQAVDKRFKEAAHAGVDQVDLTGVSAYNMTQLPPSAARMQAVSRLKMSNTGIASIGPLSDLGNLEVLDLSYSRNLTDISPLAGLNKLTELNLFRVPFGDLRPLRGLSNLKSLDIERCETADLTPISTLHALEHLNLANTPFTDLSALTGLSNLKSLSLWNTGVTDFTPLAALTRLERLDLWNTRISDLAPLKGLSQLKVLNLSHTDITDVTPVLGHEDLTYLALWNTPCQSQARGVRDYDGRWFDSDVSGYARRGDLVALKDCVARGAMISQDQWEGPMHVAVRENQIDICRFFLSLDPHLANDMAHYDGVYPFDTPLSLAIDYQRPEIIELLLQSGAVVAIDYDNPDHAEFDTPELGGLHMGAAARAGDVALLRRFLAAGAAPNARDADGLTGLHWAVGQERREAAHFLLSLWRAEQGLPPVEMTEMTQTHLTEAMDQIGDPQNRFGLTKTWARDK